MAAHSTVETSAVRPNEPPRQVIATFDNYADAERVVDYLSDRQFEVDRLAIVGRDMEYHEQILGRLNYGGAALRGAGSGALVGLLIGWIFGLFNWIQPLVSALVLAGYGLIFGAVVGALVGLVAHALQRGRRDFYSASGLRPKYYDVLADVAVADRAIRLLGGATDRRE
ncbi:MAG: hypothetical protein QOC76_1783 [Mycobacterium sp.]|jgi:hypothetical protein|nr:hypothetical protein [Mycobacterium sp.]